MIRKLWNGIALAAALLATGCTEDLPQGGGGKPDYSQMTEVTLSSITTTQANASTRADEVINPMAVGKTFRLYAFPKGEAAMNKLITTRTYTIESTAGVPVLDAGQDALYLPAGELDIFLVGPVKHDENEGLRDENDNPLPPNFIDVATPSGVYPRYGVDLISSRTPLTVKPGANQFQAEPLVHRMAQMEVVIQRPDDASYTDLNVNAISVMNQTLTGIFEFNDAGGEITPADEGTETLSPLVRTVEPGKDFRGTMYVIPRKRVQLRIGAFLTCKPTGTDATIERRMESGIMDEALVAGVMNRFITKPHLSENLIFRLRLMPWEDVTMDDLRMVPNPEILFSYSGMDAPRLINGKMCVPDRSGNGNHGELVGDIVYDASGKYYYANSKGAYIKVPSLGSVPRYMFEFTATSEKNNYCFAAQFNGGGVQRTMGVHLPWSGHNIYFDSGDYTNNRVTTSYNPADLNLMNHPTVYAFTHNKDSITIYRNGEKLNRKYVGSLNQGQMIDNRLLWWNETEAKCQPRQLKMYAARLTIMGRVDHRYISNNYRNDIMTFTGIDLDVDYAKRDYVEEGLILDLRGTDGKFTNLTGNPFMLELEWQDHSKFKNHAKLKRGSSLPFEGNAIKFNKSNHLQLKYPLGKLQTFTVEIVARASSTQTTLLNFSSHPQGGDAKREFHIHWAWEENGSNNFKCNSPSRGSVINITKSMNSLPYTYAYLRDKPNQLCFVRRNEGGKTTLDAWLNGILAATASREPESLLNEMRYCFIGSNGISNSQFFDSYIYAIRVYNRALTDMERQHNYLTDKKKYNLVP